MARPSTLLCPVALPVLLIASLLAGCASRPGVGALLTNYQASAGAKDHTILVATSRARDPRPGTFFGGERSQSVNYATLTVAVPPTHVPGKIEWPSRAPGNPMTDFVVRDGSYLDGERGFVKTLNAQLAMRPPGRRKVLVFIHGYNTTFPEGLYRFTQIVDDANAPAVPVLFTWASRGHLTDYVYDSNSATAARDELEHTLRLVFASNADEINILAHSMGNWLTPTSTSMYSNRRCVGLANHESRFSLSCLTTIKHCDFLILLRAGKSVSDRIPTMRSLPPSARSLSI